MEGIDAGRKHPETDKTGKSEKGFTQFSESFETFNKIISNLQRQYLTLEKEYGQQGQRLEEINEQLRRTIADNRAVASFLNSILTSLSSGVVAVDCDGVISHYNKAAEQITGIGTSRALGYKYDEVISAREGGQFSALGTILSGTEFDSEEKTILNHAGNEIPVSVSTSLLKGGDDDNMGAVEIFFDLTKTKKLEEEISRVKTLAALGEMAATVAHEVRNPLGGIAGFASLLKRELEGDEEKAKLAEKIITGVDTLNRTVVALLDYTHKDQLNLRSVSLEALLEDTVGYDRAEMKAAEMDEGEEGRKAPRIKMEVLVGDRNLKLLCDPHLMRQMLLNLLRNSREAMPDGGEITIIADRVSDEHDCPVQYPAVWIEVEDNGCGIDEEIIDKIFQPFFSAKEGNNGSGLGLATVYKTVQAHNGKISVKSEAGKGSVFRIVLPINP